MQRSASGIGDCSEGEGARKLAKFTAGGGKDFGGSLDGSQSVPYPPMWQGDNMSPTPSEQVTMIAEASSQQCRSWAVGNGPKLPISSAQGIDDEGRGGKQGRNDEQEEEKMENAELGQDKNTVHPVPDHERVQQILNSFTPEQANRYESYRRSGFERSKMSWLLAKVAACPISPQIAIAMSGISKLFVGDLVETGRIVMTERNHVGPLRPCHIREAYRRLQVEGKVPSKGSAPRFR